MNMIFWCQMNNSVVYKYLKVEGISFRFWTLIQSWFQTLLQKKVRSNISNGVFIALYFVLFFSLLGNKCEWKTNQLNYENINIFRFFFKLQEWSVYITDIHTSISQTNLDWQTFTSISHLGLCLPWFSQQLHHLSALLNHFTAKLKSFMNHK